MKLPLMLAVIFAATSSPNLSRSDDSNYLPTRFSASATSCQQIDLKWTRSQERPASLTLEIGYNGASGTFGSRGYLSWLDSSYSDTWVYPAREYCYRIKGEKTCDKSPCPTGYTTIVCVTTPGIAPAKPGVPALSVMTGKQDGYVNLNWLVNPGNLPDYCVKQTWFEIWRQTASGALVNYGRSYTNSSYDEQVGEGKYTYAVKSCLSALPDICTSLSPTATINIIRLSASVSGNGTINGTGISCPSDCSELFSWGTKITLTATPGASGMQFSSWTGACANQGNPCTLTLTNTTSVAATFLYNDDIDGDGRPNAADNCPLIANPDQFDTDLDGKGNICDNCNLISNRDQADTDKDAIGDACDNCRLTSNSTQLDTDKDGIGDACDNCKLTSNKDQGDTDKDGVGDVCDNCKVTSNTTQIDTDKDGFGDTCDTCPTIADPNQPNNDGDAYGDACDPDDDNDGRIDSKDNCPLLANPTQVDADKDGVGDACDLDWLPAVLDIVID